MRIVHLSTCLEYYGGEVCLANLACGFAERGHEVSCLVRPESALAQRLAGRSVEVVPLAMIDWFDPGTIVRVGRWLRQHQVDVLATHLPRDYFIAATAARGLPICNIATRHQLKPLSLPVLKRPFLRGFGAVIAVSEAVAAGVHQARLVHPARVVTVPNGIVAPTYAGTRSELRRRAGLSQDDLVIGLVGKLCPEKGADFLLRAVAHLRERNPDLHVILLGDGGGGNGYGAHLEDLVRTLGLTDRVHFPGFVSEVAPWVQQFDVQVVASQAEPFGLVTLEAMAAGVPVVATNTGGSPEILTDGAEGFLVSPGDVDQLADRLTRLLKSQNLRRDMGNRGRVRYRDHFTIEHMLARTEAVYRAALERNRPDMMIAEG
ncbi:MAG: glycosyltransferase family 4 protein [Candidatus Krumholzibacteria bacterium]|nr:glycosyltransferase family 4 protein [Candidatus Krumholzibacteria bacterium]